MSKKEKKSVAEEIRDNQYVQAYYKKGNEILGRLGYTDHSMGHAAIVAEEAARILRLLGYDEHTIELAKIAGCLHDIGNAINRRHHAEYGALLAREILSETELSVEDQVTIVAAVANHDESTGMAYDPVSAALVIADKTDVRRNRVRKKDPRNFDMHDRVNYAVTGSNLVLDKKNGKITLNLQIDGNICSMYDYFEIFLERMLMCRRAAEVFEMNFRLKANGQKVL